jgi:hypothetical protein
MDHNLIDNNLLSTDSTKISSLETLKKEYIIEENELDILR